jgi:hypothetical protein
MHFNPIHLYATAHQNDTNIEVQNNVKPQPLPSNHISLNHGGLNCYTHTYATWR